MATVVIFRHDHKHRKDIADSAKFKSPNQKIKDMFLNFSYEGYTPSRDLSKYLSGLKTELDDYYFTVSADISICSGI